MKTKENSGGITLDIPQREGKEGYIGMYFSLFLRMGEIIASSNFKDTTIRIEILTRFLISLIPNESIRAETSKKLKEKIEVRIKESKEENKDLTEEEIGNIRLLACIEVIGEVSDFIDKHIGVSRENRVGVV